MSKRNRHNNTRHEIRRSLIFVGKSFQTLFGQSSYRHFLHQSPHRPTKEKKDNFAKGDFVNALAK